MRALSMAGQPLRAVLDVCILFHAASGVAGVASYAEGAGAVALGNAAFRVLMVALFFAVRARST